MGRAQVTERILAAKVESGITWAEVAKEVGLSKEWVTAACLGQMALDFEQAKTVQRIFELTDGEARWLTEVPMKGTLGGTPPSDPLVYRFYELVSVYGPVFKELISEEFGDGIMSAIDFNMALEREADPKGDRVKITMSGKFLPYRSY